MKEPKPKGLAKILNPEKAANPPEEDWTYPFPSEAYPQGLQPFHFEPTSDGTRQGEHRQSYVDRLLSVNEEHAAIVTPPLPPLCRSWRPSPVHPLRLPPG